MEQRLVASKMEFSRLEFVSSGQNMRKFVRFILKMSRKKSPSLRERNQRSPAIHMGTAAHAPVAPRRECRQFFNELAIRVKEFLRFVASHPSFKNFEMLGILTNGSERDLVCAESAFDRDSIHFFRASPSLGRAQNDHGPNGLLLESVPADFLLN
jgi:hypothetical protein